MGKSFDAFRKILREQKLDSYFRENCFGKYLDLPEDNNARFQMKMVDITATIGEHNKTVDNPSTASKDEEKVELWRMEELPQPKVSQNEECLINIIKGFSIPIGLHWHLIDEMYIPINCGDESHWVLAVVILKERRIRVYDSMSLRRRSGPSSEIQKLAKILPTYLDISVFLDQKVRIDWSTIEAYWDKMANPFDVQYVDGIAQQTIGIFKRYAALLWKYGEAKAQKSYATDIKDPRRPKPNSIALDEEQLVHID
ncbi:hypothetical protein T459_15688 [Capsicum annuum]|uniref:Ubiquitin-like protease family profile domain-containing protein n=1 Tax=Capsicum annuum TaxID=4072 RepID=A0A2G2Z6K7_CAPAN|nr:hypothetical protein T459_15688 [Capsicum annuum]